MGEFMFMPDKETVKGIFKMRARDRTRMNCLLLEIQHQLKDQGIKSPESLPREMTLDLTTGEPLNVESKNSCLKTWKTDNCVCNCEKNN